MAQIIIEDLDPAVLEKLEAIAQKNGRSLQSELKHILAAAASPSIPKDIGIIIKKAEIMREQIARHAGLDINQLQPIDREKAAIKLAEMKAIKTISAGEMSIKQMREEGRRF
jgi:antitoxin FitA